MRFIELQDGEKLAFLMPEQASGPQVIFLHGIMGSSKNWQSFIKLFYNAFAGYTPIAFDLPNHGASMKHCAPFSVAQAASRIVEGIQALQGDPYAIVGHSFGGKVAALVAEHLPSVRQLWVLDSSLSALHLARPLGAEKDVSACQLLDILTTFTWPQKSRKEFVSALLAHGVSNQIALWMTTNLISSGDGDLELGFTPSELQAMLKDFFDRDMWSMVPKLSKTMEIHMVQAEWGYRLREDDAQKLQQQAGNKGFFHVLKKSGHFVQADNPEGLLELMRPHFAVGPGSHQTCIR